MFFAGFSIPYCVSVDSDFSIFGNRHNAKHRRVICFIGNFGAFQCRDMEVMYMIDFFGMVNPIHIHVKISGKYHSSYTSFDRGELFINGRSLGVRQKDPSNLYTTYRLVWDEVIYEPGELKIVALDENNNPLKEFFL